MQPALASVPRFEALPTRELAAPQSCEARLVHGHITGRWLVVAGIVRGRCIVASAPAAGLTSAPDLNDPGQEQYRMRAVLCATLHPARPLTAYLH